MARRGCGRCPGQRPADRQEDRLRRLDAPAADGGRPARPAARRPALLLSENVHPRVVMELLGHSQMRTTMDIYSHVMPALAREAADRMGALLLTSKGRQTATTIATTDAVDSGRDEESAAQTGGPEGSALPCWSSVQATGRCLAPCRVTPPHRLRHEHPSLDSGPRTGWERKALPSSSPTTRPAGRRTGCSGRTSSVREPYCGCSTSTACHGGSGGIGQAGC
jgi:integrase